MPVNDKLVISITIMRVLEVDGEDTMSKPLIEEKISVASVEEALSKIAELAAQGIQNLFRFV